MHRGQLRVCFVAQNAYGALACTDSGHAGGIETQSSLMARWFASHGYAISMITWDEGQCDGVEVSGVNVIRMCRRDAGCPGLRFLHPRWTSLDAAMKRADADVYYYNCGDLGLGQVVMWCRRHGRKSVYSVASDPDCDPTLPVLKPLRERFLYRYGLKHADSVIVQTQHQREMLRTGSGISATVIPMPCEGLVDGVVNEPVVLSRREPRVLWVGRISIEKRFEWLLDVAERCPEITFDVVGAANSDSRYVSMLTRRAAEISNVCMYGRVPHGEIGSYYRRCHVLCCTSAHEGFPNTFLEAWSLGIPVVSTFDPDDIIARYNLGWKVQTTDGLARALRESTTDWGRWGAASEAAREYYRRNHTLDLCMQQFAHVFRQVSASQMMERAAT